MNPTSRIWDIPPPPGTEDFDLEEHKPTNMPEPELNKEKSEEKETLPTEEDEKPLIDRPIDRINPYLKNPEYIEYEKRHLERRRRSRSRSYSREKHRRRRYSRSRSRSRDRYRRSRSRRRRRRYSSSRSRSRSSSHRRHRYTKRQSRSSSRYSRSRSQSRQHVRRYRNYKDRKSPPLKKSSNEREKAPLDADISEIDMKIEEEEEDQTKDNVFKNDGTFLEMFKKMQEQQQVQVQENPAPEPVKKPFPAFGKRRGGKVLKTGMVQKLKQQTEEEATSQDAWSVYMKEVRKYKEACCDDDSKTRPLVK